MATLVSPALPRSPDYRGLDAIFEYANVDGLHQATNCGQAAAATFLTQCGVFSANPQRAMRLIERPYPPDHLGGYLGTSRRLITRICKAHGVPLRAISGEAALRTFLAQGDPVLVMLGASAGKFCNFELPGGHWMVAYGFDAHHVYLTNWHPMTWEEFRRGWDGFVPRLIQMRNRGLVARPRTIS